jgi:hypothetical protein
MFHFIPHVFLGLSLFSLNCYALNSNAIEQQADSSIKELYHSLKTLPNNSMTERLNWFSAQFKDKKYLLGSLGEGPNALYDQFPRYRTDGFDCDTFVNTVLALALSDSLPAFQHCINELRYQNGVVSYIQRNHFTSIDWNKNNQQLGIINDITLTVHDQNNKPVAQYAVALIDKPSWYAHKKKSTIRLNNNDNTKQTQRLAELKKKGSQLERVTSKVAYLPLKVLFPDKNKPDLYLFSQIPNGAIIEIVRPNWDIREQIGTHLNISHLGFAFWQNNTLYFRQASSQYGKVVDVPLVGYLKDALNSPTIKGISVLVVTPQKVGICGS